MAISVVPLTSADSQRLLDVDLAAFFFDPTAVPVEAVTAHFDWSRTFGATRDGGADLVGVYTSYDMAVTAPGPLGTLTSVPMAGLSWVSVHPDQRRQGALTTMVTRHFEQLREQGVALSGLHASEVGIYGRFGYAVSSLDHVLTLGRGTTFTAPPYEEAAGRVSTWFVRGDHGETAAAVHEVHRRCARVTLGAVTRPEMMARPLFIDLPLRRIGQEPMQVLFASVDGELTGYAIFSRKPSWKDGTARGTVTVPEVAATDPASLLALARRLVDFDLTAEAEISARGADDPLVWWAGGPRATRLTTYDALWLRFVDVAAALTARGYASPCDVVLDVVDPTCPWNQRRWRLLVDEQGVATCLPTDEEAQVRLPVQALGAAYLGSRTLVSQARQGLVRELRPGTLRPLSRAMSDDREPVGAIEF